MKIVVFGATGDVGTRIVTEAIQRGHHVTAVVRNKASLSKLPEHITVHIADARNPSEVAEAMNGQDLAISSLRTPSGQEGEVVGLTQSILKGAARAGIRVIIVGGAARLHLPNGSPHSVLTAPGFLPESVVPTARASYAQYELCSSDLVVNWTYASPAALLRPGTRRGTYRTGTDTLLVDEDGNSEISMEDFAAALVEEAQNAQFVRTSFTVGY
ncbi:NmrA-like family protein [Roseovarius albus]|uniref:NmrA-like family protein n=1 Tax=Roseovarius albus TaxID=1247867 RepID=A0A1X6ZM88_9RHOB|nr:NAD(P)H-binding protein [Roseovarius albus]SLN55846.1 NmrA-like family protein [Roseovarius albus]